MVLFVEGDGEYEQFPRLASQLFGIDFPRARILIENLKGTGNFEGKKRQEKYGALEKLIDKWHALDTIVFVVLDREGRAPQVAENLINRTSHFHPKRKVTKRDYIHLWNKSVEFDNFSHEEIARAMTELSSEKGQRYEFLPNNILDCETKYDAKQGNPLGALYSEKCGGNGLPKTRLLELLVGQVLKSQESEFDNDGMPKRPIVKVIAEILRLAALNHQPSRQEIWEENQISGYFGDPVEESN